MREIQTKINDIPETSVNKLVVQIDILHAISAFYGMERLKLHVYRATLVQELLPPDLLCCLAFYK